MPHPLAPRLRQALVDAVAARAPRPRRPLPRNPRLLLLRPDHLGDVLLTSPAVEALRQAAPRAHLTYLVGPWSLEVARRGPRVDVLDTLEFPGFTRRPKGTAWSPYVTLLLEARRLRTARFDAALVLRPDHWWGALLAALAGVPTRIGYAGPLTSPLLSEALPLPDEAHSVELALALAARAAARIPGATALPRPAPPPRCALAPADVAAAARLLEQHGLGAARLVVLHPGSGSRLKGWPAARWAAVGDAAAALVGGVLLVTGGSDELPLAREVAAAARQPVALLAGQTSFGTLAALLRRAELVLGGDSGPLHLAAALGAPTLRLYGPTDPRRFGPWAPGGTVTQRLVRAALPCSPCGDLVAPPCGARACPPCMTAISTRQVLSELGLLGRGR